MNFGQALEALKNGQRVARTGWNGKGMWLCMVTNWNGNFGGDLPPTYSVAPFIAMKSATDAMTPWQPSQADQLAVDWVELDFQSTIRTAQQPGN